jgi:hypothetical protein
VKLTQMPRPDWINVIAQLEKGDVQFSVLPPLMIGWVKSEDSTAFSLCRIWEFSGSKTANGC